MPIGVGQHLQQHHHQFVPRFHRELRLVVHGLQLLLTARLMALHHSNLADHIAFRHIDAGVGPQRRCGAAYVVHISGVLVVIHALRRPQPEIRQVAHAQVQVGFVDCTVRSQEELARERVAQQMGIELADDLGQILGDDWPRSADDAGVCSREAYIVRHIAEKPAGFRNIFSRAPGRAMVFRRVHSISSSAHG